MDVGAANRQRRPAGTVRISCSPLPQPHPSPAAVLVNELDTGQPPEQRGCVVMIYETSPGPAAAAWWASAVYRGRDHARVRPARARLGRF